ncbi:hypothetical protein CcCBS67573_g04730 [Chytriomyces confervae]|uniref:Uncharacterized protein n=1 Tax=Chytriomyces confervae TaxID=246404 RepID=A0A507FFB9_9FUNG|nr:hypothetical protein CcCBS67573_g04730 [Chytriomyces confervae]
MDGHSEAHLESETDQLNSMADGSKSASKSPATPTSGSSGSVLIERDFSDAALDASEPFEQGIASKPYVTPVKKCSSANGLTDADAVDFDDFFDDVMCSFESGIESFVVESSLFTLVAIWSCISMVDLISPTPLRIDWFAFCLVSVKTLHRSVRSSILMIFLLLVYFTIINTCILGLFNVPAATHILPLLASVSMYSHVCFSMSPKKSLKWPLACLFVIADAMFKTTPSTEKEFLAGAHCISFTTYSAFSKIIATPISLHVTSITCDQITLSWSLPNYCVSNVTSVEDKSKGIMKSSVALDFMLPHEFAAKQKSTTQRKLSSKMPAEWDFLIFRNNQTPYDVKTVSLPDLSVTINGMPCSKADLSNSLKKQTLTIKVAPADEYEISVTLANIGSEHVRVSTPKKVVSERKRGGGGAGGGAVQNIKQPATRSVGTAATELCGDALLKAQQNSSPLTPAPTDPRLLAIASLREELDTLQTKYKAAQANMKRIRRDQTRSTCSLKAEIEASQNNITKDISLEHKTKQRLQSIQDFITSNEVWIQDHAHQVKDIEMHTAKNRDGELKRVNAEIQRLRETLKATEKTSSRISSQLSKAVTVASAEMSALIKIQEEVQKELKQMDGGIESLKRAELSRVEAQIEQAWNKQQEVREIAEQRVKERERALDEKRNALRVLRLACEQMHSKNADVEANIKEKRAKNDVICEELMTLEDNSLKAEDAFEMNGRSHKMSERGDLTQWYHQNQTENVLTSQNFDGSIFW